MRVRSQATKHVDAIFDTVDDDPGIAYDHAIALIRLLERHAIIESGFLAAAQRGL